MIAALRAGLAAVLSAGVLAVNGCSTSLSSHCPADAPCPATAPRVTFSLDISGHPAVLRRAGQVPRFRVRAGAHVLMRVAVTVPRDVRVTALWFGISGGSWGFGPTGPTGMRPVLAHFSHPLSQGAHTFGLRWSIPKRLSGTSLYLTYAWSSHTPPAGVSGAVAQLAPN